MEGVISYLEDTMNFIKCVIRYVEISQRSQLVELQFMSLRPGLNVELYMHTEPNIDMSQLK